MLTIATAQPRQPAQGKRLLHALRSRGIDAANVTRNRRTGVYTVKFASPNMHDFDARGTEPAHVWAQRIEDAFTDIEIVDTYDSVAEWRPQQPILFASVFCRVIEKQKSATAEAITL